MTPKEIALELRALGEDLTGLHCLVALNDGWLSGALTEWPMVKPQVSRAVELLKKAVILAHAYYELNGRMEGLEK